MIKAITGCPISMEGKSASCAHFSPVGNIAAAMCDLWSNESVQNVRLLSGSAPEAYTELLIYDCRLMNTAACRGRATELRDWLAESDEVLSPQALLLSPAATWRIAQAIVGVGDGYRRTLAEYLIIPEVLQALGVIPSADAASFTLQDLSGKVFALDVAAVPLAASLNYVQNPDPAQGFFPLYRTNADQNYWFQYLDTTRTLYFAYNRASEMPGVPFESFAQQLAAAFASQPFDRLVVDLRNNTGGSTAVLQPMIDDFMKSGGAAALQGRLFVIIGRRTYSTALIHAIQVKLQLGAILVGEPSGNKPNHPGNVLSFTLPNCGLTVNYSTKLFTLWPTDVDSLYPDVRIDLWSSDVFARHDPFFAAVLAYQATGGEL